MKKNYLLIILLGVFYSCSLNKNVQTQDLTSNESDSISVLKIEKPDTNRVFLNGKELKVSNKKSQSILVNPKTKKPTK